MIFDSNLIIYSPRPEYPGLRRLLARASPLVSLNSKVEVIGYHKITDEEQLFFGRFFASTPLVQVTEPIINCAVSQRQAKKMSDEDAIIAATALLTGHELNTDNIKDIAGIPGLTVVDPLAHGEPP